jgi:hypothetical protein
VAELERIRQSARASGAQYESAVARIRAALAAHQARVDAKRPEPVTPEAASPPAGPVPGGTRALAPRVPAPRPSARTGATPGAGPAGSSGTAAGPPPGAIPGATEAPPHPWRQKTDPAGLFAFDPLPSGDWLVVALRISAYTGEKLRGAPHPRAPSGRGRGLGFLPRTAGPAKGAELWVVRVRGGAGERAGLDLTDRSRWMVGPVR